uniref:Uncharacterized protein n=1 Tax=Anguilla anguilla TaxID=7936 RepID=A0A0E9WGF7_ANGAN
MFQIFIKFYRVYSLNCGSFRKLVLSLQIVCLGLLSKFKVRYTPEWSDISLTPISQSLILCRSESNIKKQSILEWTAEEKNVNCFSNGWRSLHMSIKPISFIIFLISIAS